MRMMLVKDASSSGFLHRAREALKRSVHPLILVLAAAPLLLGATGYKVNYNATVTVNEWKICKKVTNAHASGNALFVPTNTSNEWSVFRAKAPAGVTLARCNTWTQAADLPTTRSYAGAALLGNGHVLFCGGFAAGTSATSRCDSYDPASNTFSSAHALASARMALGMIGMASGDGFVTGGFNSSEFAGTYSYDASSNSFTSLANHPSARHAVAIARDSSGNIYTFGGYAGSTGSGVYRYNVSGNSWTTMAALPSARMYAAAATLGSGKILICGGKSSGGAYLNRCDLYNPASNTYTQVANLPEAKSGPVSAPLEDGTALFCGGALSASAASNRCDIYDEGTNSFTQVANLPEAVAVGAMAPLNDGRVITCSGDPVSSSTYSNSCYIYQP